MANYGRIFRSAAGRGDARPTAELADYVASLEKAGIVRAVPFGVSNDEASALLRDFPGRFIGLARISGSTGHARRPRAGAAGARGGLPGARGLRPRGRDPG